MCLFNKKDTSKTYSVERIISNKKGFQVLKDGQLYYRHRINNDSIYWKCVHAKKDSKCKGTITISDNDQI